MSILEIKNLHARIEDKEILRGINLTILPGEVHAIMGPNGSGKSTLANVLAGKDGYEITAGSVSYMGKDLLDMEPDERAGEGVFLSFQHPVEIPGIGNAFFLRTAVNAVRAYRGEDKMTAGAFLKAARQRMKIVELPDQLLKRSLNEGFSGGEKKRNEIFQMLMLEPTLAILDETDSGLDIDALRVVSQGINSLRSPDRGMLVITHYQRLLDHLVPDHTHVLVNGRIVKTGGRELALELEKRGYAWIHEELAAAGA